jgi:small subunit ribosomal protein S4
MAKSRPRGSTNRYGIQLEEKRNLKKIFGVREAQLRRYYREARSARSKETGPYLVELLERRLDNALYRAGFAVTRAQARQMASHRLVEVNERPVNIPSLRLTRGDTVRVKESKRSKSHFKSFAKRLQNAQAPEWLKLDPVEFSFTVTNEPTLAEAKLGVDVQAVVELLAR